MQATAEGRTSGRRGPGDGPGLRALGNGAASKDVTPHDLYAEESLLGAMLLSGVAVDAGMAECEAGDFYKPAHGHVFYAVATLRRAGTPVDPATTAAVLRQDGLLDAIGGPATLISLQANTPAIGNAAHYAAIVAHCARHRRLQATGIELASAARDQDDAAVARALEQAQDVVSGSRPELVVEDLGAVIRGEEPEIVPTMLFRSDGLALIYPGLLHWVMGEPGCGKTWMALVAELAAVQAGIPSLYLDYEGSRRIVGARLAHLGASEYDAGQIAYVRPQGGSTTTGPGALRLVQERAIGLVVIDGAAKAMAREGLDEDRASDVLGFLERMVWPLCEAEAAVVILDHVPKDKDNRGRWARGSGAKLGEVDGAAYSVRVGKAWSRSQAGYAAIDVAKDREGVVGAVGDCAALLKFAPSVVGGLRAWIDPPATGDTQHTVHSAVEQAVHDCGELSQIRLEHEVREFGKWSHESIRNAAESLAESGRIKVRTGPRNARLYSPIHVPDSDIQLHIVETELGDF